MASLFASDLLHSPVQVPDYALTVEGVPIPAVVLRAITSISVTQMVNQAASFSLQVHDPAMLLIDAASGLFAEGRKISLSMGYVGQIQALIEGEITAIGVELDQGGGLTLQIDGFDSLHAAGRGTAYREFRDGQTDSAIVQEIAQAMGLNALVDQTGTRSDRRVQAHISNLAYLQQLTRLHDFQLWVENRTLCFRKLRTAPLVNLVRGRNLISFSARLSTSGHVGRIEVRGWDAAQKQAFMSSVSAAQSQSYLSALSMTGAAQITGGAEEVIHADGQARSIDEAQRMAQARLDQQGRSLLSAEGSAIGDPSIRVGSTIVVSDMARFSGRYIAEQVRHTIDQGGYRTSFEMRQQL